MVSQHLGPEGTTYALTIVNAEQLVRMLTHMADPDEFLSDFGLRSTSKRHGKNPFVLGNASVVYEPGEADCKATTSISTSTSTPTRAWGSARRVRRVGPDSRRR